MKANTKEKYLKKRAVQNTKRKFKKTVSRDILHVNASTGFCVGPLLK